MDKTIILVFVGCFTTLLGTVINHFLSESRERRSIFNKAAEQFRDSFWKEVEFLDNRFFVDRASTNAIKKSCDLLFDAIGRHQKAVFIFSNHLCWIDRYRFMKAWNKYCKGGSNIMYFKEEYPCGNEFQQYDSEAKALKRINDFLKFAKPK